MLHIHFANRIETLSALLVERLGARGAGVFDADPVLVPSAALRQHVTLALARAHGVCAHQPFAYPARWLWQQIGRAVPGVGEESPFDPGVLVWRVHAALADTGWAGVQPRLGAYLARADALTRHELAQRIAQLFDQYLTYRSDWLAAWARGESVDLGAPSPDQAWQAALWRRLLADTGSEGRDPLADFAAALHAGRAPLPACVYVFALPTLAPQHLGLLSAIARHTEVQLYALNPCAEYWFEVVDRRRLGALALRDRAAHHEEGHRLLAAWGRQTQAQLTLLVDAAGDGAVDQMHFERASGDTLLARWHNALLDLVEITPAPLAADDRSIEVHVCHSLAREIEVLHDRLLGLLGSGIAPGEVLVVTPDLDAAAPLVDAVFGTAPPERHIPYALAGRARAQVNAPARALLGLLALLGSRCGVSEVFALLQQPVVARRFGLDDDALQQLHGWLLDAGAHWALHAAQRTEWQLPADGRHTLADAFERLLLGYALPDGVAEPFAGKLSAGGAEGSAALALGGLGRYLEALDALRSAAAAAPAASDWPGLLAGALADFVDARGDDIDALRELQAALDTLALQWRRGAPELPLPLAVVHSALAAALDEAALGGTAGGAVNFASMAALRALPFKVVCVLGLNDGAFPSTQQALEFDLMAQRPRAGDRQRRLDERNLFLDLLLAARDTVHLSYTGRDVRDNSALPPSVLVSELLEVLEPAIGGGTAARARLVVEHPLQAFSERAFRSDVDPRLRSHRREYADALNAARVATPALALHIDDDDDEEVAEAGSAFFAAALAEPGEEWREVALLDLLRFFRNPSRYLLERRLAVALPRDEAELSDDEAFVADIPSRSALCARLLPALLAGADEDALRALAFAGTELPAGAFGARSLERELAALRGFAAPLAAALREPCLPPHAVSVTVDLDGEPWRVQHAFADLRAGGLVGYRYDELRAGDHLDAWLRHLMLCADTPAGVLPTTTWHGRDQVLQLQPCRDARAQLRTLLGLYRAGLREPLPFFPKSAWVYADSGGKLGQAQGKWNVSAMHPHGEAADAAYRLALRGRPDPLAEDNAAFVAHANAVFGPLLAHRLAPGTT